MAFTINNLKWWQMKLEKFKFRVIDLKTFIFNNGAVLIYVFCYLFRAIYWKDQSVYKDFII